MQTSKVLITSLLACGLVFFTLAGRAEENQRRIRYTINEGWRFIPHGLAFGHSPKVADSSAESVSIPHTWNAEDPFDSRFTYRRGISWYRKELVLDEELSGKRIYLFFEGVNQVADVYLNTVFLGQHKGGYTAFTVDITDYARFGADAPNLLAVQVDNSHDNHIPPLSVGYALYGGIYRDVWLVAADPVHFKLTDHGSCGIYIHTPRVSGEEATVGVRGTLVNDSPESQNVKVISRILDQEGKLIDRLESGISAGPSQEVSFAQQSGSILQPRLWSPEDPYLYQVVSEIWSGDQKLDEVRNPLGFRWFRFDPAKGFSLNGEKYILRGTNRHQDMMGNGHALSNADHRSDLEIIKEMGCNFLRLAHYPQDPYVLSMADSLGLLIWEEIPLVNYMNISEAFVENSSNMIREMVRQHYNHPSVILWGSMNEIFLWSKEGARIRNHTDNEYARQVYLIARQLDDLIRMEDPGRYTAMAIHGSNYYDQTGVADVAQVLGLNRYDGWYGGTFPGFGRGLDRRHENHPEQILFVSEYGAGSDRRLNSLEPRRFDFTGQWQRLYHESHLRQIRERPYLAGTAIWNQFDFSQPHTGGSIIHRNQKGMLTWDRRYKDVYFLYKANWNPEPMVYIASRDWQHRAGTNPGANPGEGYAEVKQPVRIYANLPEVELRVNGKSLGTRTPDDLAKIEWEVPFRQGVNQLIATGTKDGQLYQDRMEIHFTYLPPDLSDPSVPFHVLGINVGGNAQFTDPDGLVWVSDQSYQPGGYGYIEGEASEFHKDLIIYNTDDTPLYYTFRENLSGYRVDVPGGRYEVELYFAESRNLDAGERLFGVSINGEEVEPALDLAGEQGFRKAFYKRYPVEVAQGESLRISFDRIAGAPVLNALKIIRKQPRSWYIDARGGKDSNEGTTPQKAWKSLEMVNNQTFVPGDSILFRAGEQWFGSLMPRGSGAEGSPIVIDRYGKGPRPEIHGEGRTAQTLLLDNQEYWEIRNLRVTNFENAAPEALTRKRGIYIRATDMGPVRYFRLYNLEVDSVNSENSSFTSRYYGGIFFEIRGTEKPTWFEDILVEKCDVHDLSRTGISTNTSWMIRTLNSRFGDYVGKDTGGNERYDNWVPSTGIIFRNNTLKRISGNGIIVRVADKPLIEHNYLDSCGLHISGNAAFCFNTDSALFQYNEACYTVYNEGDTDARGIDSDFRTKHTIIQYNYMHHNEYGGVVATGGPGNYAWLETFNEGTVIRYNILADNKDHILRTSGNLTNLSFYNNVVYTPSGVDTRDINIVENGQWSGGYAKNLYYANNIFYHLGSQPGFDFGESEHNVFEHNLFAGNRASGEPSDPGKITADPKFRRPGTGDPRGYMIRRSSPAKGAGMRIPGAPEKDYFGNPLPAGGPVDIGIHQLSQQQPGFP